ncbi:hypothetical protein PISMIDRAFT_634815, partial [Pisolithus microcarpus 441]
MNFSTLRHGSLFNLWNGESTRLMNIIHTSISSICTTSQLAECWIALTSSIYLW